MWKVQLRAGTGTGENEKWFQIQDLIVEEIRKEMIFLGETVIQVPISSFDNRIVVDLVHSRSGNVDNPLRRAEGYGVYSPLAFKFAVPRMVVAQYVA